MTSKVYLVMTDDGLERPVTVGVFSTKSKAEEYLDSKFIYVRDNVWEDKEVFCRLYFIDEWKVD